MCILEKGRKNDETMRTENLNNREDNNIETKNDCVEEDPEAFTEKQDLLLAFTRYCKDRGFIPTSDKKFIEDFRKQVYCRETQIKTGNRRPRVFQGIKLNLSHATITGITGITPFPTSTLEDFPPELENKSCDPCAPYDQLGSAHAADVHI
jgi:hypothetical protein